MRRPYLIAIGIVINLSIAALWQASADLEINTDRNQTAQVKSVLQGKFFSAATETEKLPRALTEDPGFLDEFKEGRREPSLYLPGSSISENPDTINVAITAYANCAGWLAAGQPVIRVETLPFKDYVKNVLPNEWISTWHPEALKAGALAAKVYGWRKINVGARHYLKTMHNLDKAPDIVDNTCDQRYIANTARASTNAAVDAVWDYALIRNNALLIGFYLATEAQCLSSPYQPCIPQWGTQFRALEGKTWEQIIQQYYGPVVITELTTENFTPYSLYRFWSPSKRNHFFTVNRAERTHILRTYPKNIYTYEGIAYETVSPDQPGAIPVYRFYSPRFDSHFFTGSSSEKDFVVANRSNDWRYEGVGYYVFPAEFTGDLREVYRFWSPSKRSHFYTASELEKNQIVSSYQPSEWTYEGVAWKVPR